MRTISILLLISLPALALAAGGGHGHGIPWKTIIYQTINVSILIGGLIFLLRKPIAGHFAQKREQFVGAAEKANAARKQAEQEHMEIKVKLNKLESSADESVSRARAEAADLKKQMVAEAENLSQRIRHEATQAARLEVVRAKTQLREALIREAFSATRTQIDTKVSKEDHLKLQGEFIQHLQQGAQR